MTDISAYLTTLAKKITIDSGEKEKIDKSIDYLQGNIWSEFRNKLLDVSVFGSYDRGTSLKSSIDKDSDVDILIVFRENEFKAQTYLNQLKSFAEKNYSKSDVYSDFPTIVIGLNHIRFELVPSYYKGLEWKGNNIKIPKSPAKELEWEPTNPEEFKNKLIKKDSKEKGNMIPLIKIIKYWNLINGSLFSPYNLEEFAVSRSYPCNNLKEYFYELVNDLSNQSLSGDKKKLISELYERRRKLKTMEKEKLNDYIGTELEAFLPMPV